MRRDRWISCAGCGCDILRHPDEPAHHPKRCRACWLKAGPIADVAEAIAHAEAAAAPLADAPFALTPPIAQRGSVQKGLFS